MNRARLKLHPRAGLNRVARKVGGARCARRGGDLGSHRKPAATDFRQPRTTGESPETRPKQYTSLEFALYFHLFESLNDITHLDVVEAIDGEAALITGCDFFDIVFEALQAA